MSKLTKSLTAVAAALSLAGVSGVSFAQATTETNPPTEAVVTPPATIEVQPGAAGTTTETTPDTTTVTPGVTTGTDAAGTPATPDATVTPPATVEVQPGAAGTTMEQDAAGTPATPDATVTPPATVETVPPAGTTTDVTPGMATTPGVGADMQTMPRADRN